MIKNIRGSIRYAMPWLIILLIATGCVVNNDRFTPTRSVVPMTGVPIQTPTARAAQVPPTPTVTQQVRRPVECPNVPVYPQAIRMSYHHSAEERIAIYETSDAPATILRWFFDHRRAPEWSWDGAGDDWANYTNRWADAYGPVIGLDIKIEETTLQKTIFTVRLTLTNPHYSDNWCPDLEP